MFALTATVWAAASSDWEHWRFRAAITAGDVNEPRLVAFTIPPEVMSASQATLDDLRVVDADAREVPLVVRARSGATTTEWRESRVLEQSKVADTFTQAVADLGAQTPVHNAAKLALQPFDDFVSWVEVAVSDDAREWRVTRERAPIYRLNGEGRGEHLTVTHPDTPARYVRFRILDTSRPYRFERIETAYEVQNPVELTDAPFVFSPEKGEKGGSVWVVRGAPLVPVAGFRVETSQSLFARAVSVETSDDGREWRYTSSGDVFQMNERGEARSRLEFRVPESASHNWRVTVLDRNDAPLTDFHLYARTIPRRVIFKQEPGKHYALVYGNERADAPHYDMQTLTTPEALDAAVAVQLASSAPNSGYTDPAPWTDRHRALVWSGLVALVLILGAVAFRGLRSA